MSDRELVGVRLPSRVKDALDRENQSNQEIVEAAVRKYLGTDEAALMKLRLENRRLERDGLVEERDALERKIGELDEEIASLESQLEDVKAEQESYEDRLEYLLGQLENGNNVWPGHGKVAGLEDSHGVAPGKVIEDLKDLAEERDLSIPDHLFEDGSRGGHR